MNTPYIHVLGTGTSVPEPGNAPSSYLVCIANKIILIDAGPGIAQNIVDAGYRLADIHTICITHIHPDHCLGLPEIIFGLIHAKQVEFHSLNICVSADYVPFTEDGLLKVWHSWFEKYDHIKYRIIPVIFHKTVSFKDFSIVPFKVNHHPSSVGYTVNLPHHCISFSGDTDIFNIEKEVDQHYPELLFLDSSTCEPFKIPGHLSIQEAVKLVIKTNIPVIYLSHFFPGERKKVEEYLKKQRGKRRSRMKIAEKGQIIPL